MTVEMTPQMESVMRTILRSGIYANETEVLDEALKLLQQRDRLRAEIQEGLQQLDSGEGIEAEDLFRELRAKAAQAGADDR